MGILRNGSTEGTWTYNDRSGGQTTQTWRGDLLDGRSEVRWPGFDPIQLEFSMGRLTSMQGRAVPSALFEDLARDAVPPPLAEKLARPVSCHYIKTPFKDAMQILRDQSETQIMIDPRFCNPKLTLSQQLGGLDLASALVLLLNQHDLDCDYRYGCLWITSARQARIHPTFQLLTQLKAGAVNHLEVREFLTHNTRMEFFETPLKDVAAIIGDSHHIPVLVDPSAVDLKQPITLNMRDVSLQSAILALCELHELDCEYRYGALWFTRPDAGSPWSDPTGVAALTPPEGSALEAAWDKEVISEQWSEEPLTSFVTRLAREKGLTMDVYQIGGVDQMQVRTNWKGLPLRDVLGIFLYENDLQCRLEGEKLVLFPAAE
jgi:hypothetical protein